MIVVVDERQDVTEAYKSSISKEGYSVVSFSPLDFLSWFQSTIEIDLSAVDALVLGEFEDRLQVAKSIKSKAGIPTIALNDVAALETTLRLFAAGIDDVVRKPVHAREIIARIAAIRRRTVGQHKQALWDLDGLTIYGGGRNPEICGQIFQVPRRELRILEYLAANKGRRSTRAQIFASVYGVFDEHVEECVVESHISKLRKKLRTELGYDPIDTQRYLGYQLVGREAMAA